MKKSKFAKIASFIVAGAMCVSMGVLAACDNGDEGGETPGGQQEVTHNWATGNNWSTNGTHHWHACLDDGCTEKKDEAKHTTPNVEGKCDVCGYQLTTPTPPEEVTVDVYFFNHENWTLSVEAKEENEDGEDVLDGATFVEWKGHTGWVVVQVPYDTAGEDLYLTISNTAGTEKIEKTLNSNGPHYITPDGTVYSNVLDAEDAVLNVNAVVYYHAPTGWNEKLFAHAYYSDKDHPDADAEWGNVSLTGEWMTYEVTSIQDGWYAISVKHPKNLTNGNPFTSFNLMLLKEDESTVAQVAITADTMWISNKGVAFDSQAAALANEAGELAPGYFRFKIYVHVDYTQLQNYAENGIVTIYAYGTSDTDQIFGGFNSTQMLKVSDDANGNAGWWSVFVDLKEGTTGSYNLILADGGSGTGHQYNTAQVTVEDNGKYINLKGHKFATQAEAEADEGAVTETVSVTLHIQKRTGWDDDTITVYFYYSGADIEGLKGWPGNTANADPDNAGWYVITVDLVKAAYENGYNIMPQQGNDTQISANMTDVWVASDGTVTPTKP